MLWRRLIGDSSGRRRRGTCRGDSHISDASEYANQLRVCQSVAVTETAERPWGTYRVLAEGDCFKIKVIEVLPGHRLSYQKHSRRSEHWFVLAGEGLVILDGTQSNLGSGDSVDIPSDVAHRIHNTSLVPLIFVEVQHGTYFGEDDINRLDDDYGRS